MSFLVGLGLVGLLVGEAETSGRTVSPHEQTDQQIDWPETHQEGHL